jgi:hypothetical protein
MTGRGSAFTTARGNQEQPVRAPHSANATVSGAVAEPVTPSMVQDAPVSASLLPAPGDRIGQYEIIGEPGRGGMGAVFSARDIKLGHKVAIKFLFSNNNNNNDPELTARFLSEARATAAYSHENIIIIHKVGEHGGNSFMVLEYLQGTPLTQLMQDGRKLPPSEPRASARRRPCALASCPRSRHQVSNGPPWSSAPAAAPWRRSRMRSRRC